MIGPLELVPLLEPMGVLVGTLGRVEHEVIAACIVRWHQVNNHSTWQPISRADIAALFGDDTHEADPVIARWARNPVWSRSVKPWLFASEGFVDGWELGANNKCTLTAKFHEGMSKRIAQLKDAHAKRLNEIQAQADKENSK